MYPKRKNIPLCKLPGVYVITNTVNGKVYVGSATSIYGRCGYHRSYLRRGKHDNRHLQRAWNKYGERSFSFDVLETCEVGNLLSREQCWIDSLDATNGANGYNQSPVAGFAMLGRNHSAESRAKMSASRQGQDTSAATNAAAMANRGRKRSAEVRAKISAGHRGKRHSAEHRANIKTTHWTKRPDAAEIIARTASKNRGRPSPKRGTKLSEEQKAKISAAHTGKTLTAEHKAKIRAGCIEAFKRRLEPSNS
jgi:group I intron endonuclease